MTRYFLRFRDLDWSIWYSIFRTMTHFERNNENNLMHEDKVTTCRRSHWKCSIKKGALKKFAKFTGKYFPVNLAKFLRTSILKNICERQLLYIRKIYNISAHLIWINKFKTHFELRK